MWYRTKGPKKVTASFSLHLSIYRVKMPSTVASSSATAATGAAGPKKVVKRVAAASPPEPVAAAPPAAPAAEKTTKRSASVSSSAAAASPAPAQRATSPAKSVGSAAPAPAAPTPTKAAAAVETPEPSLADEIATLQQQLTQMREVASNALAALKRISKKAAQEVKEARKNRRRKVEVPEGEEAAEKKPSNFSIPIPISEEMAAFVAKATGETKNTTSTRAQVSSAITKYVNDHNLRVKHDVTPDATLKKLLSPDHEGQKLTIFTIARYTKHHFLKASA
jgi:hypothetical protein